MKAWDGSLKKLSSGRLFILLFLGLLISAACGQRGVELRFATIEQQDEAGTGDLFEESTTRLIFISTPEEIAQLQGKVSPDAIRWLEGIDYEDAFAMLVTMGWRNTQGQAVNIRRIVRQGDQIDVLVTLIEPEEGAAAGGVAISPYHLVEVQKAGRFGEEIKFTLFGSLVLQQDYFIP